MADVKNIPVAQIRTDAGTQIRSVMDRAALREYTRIVRDALEEAHEQSGNGESLDNLAVPMDPIILFEGKKGEYFVGDGFHRLAAHKNNNVPFIAAHVKNGGARAALLHATGANKHGVKFSSSEKRKAVLVILADEEWKEWPNRRIADWVGVSHTMVAGLRENPNAEVKEEKGGKVAVPAEQMATIPTPADFEKVAESATLQGTPDREDLEEWARELPVSQVLSDRAGGDVQRDAIIYRELFSSDAFREFKKEVNRITAKYDIATEDEGTWLCVALNSVTNMPMPEHWKLCSACRGGGCDECGDGGYAFNGMLDPKVILQETGEL